MEALERQTFQIEMTKNTLSAFLRRLDDWHRERKSPANPEIDNSHMPCKLVIPSTVAVKLQFHLQQERRKRSRATLLCLTIKIDILNLYKPIMRFQRCYTQLSAFFLKKSCIHTGVYSGFSHFSILLSANVGGGVMLKSGLLV